MYYSQNFLIPYVFICSAGDWTQCLTGAQKELCALSLRFLNCFHHICCFSKHIQSVIEQDGRSWNLKNFCYSERHSPMNSLKTRPSLWAHHPCHFPQQPSKSSFQSVINGIAVAASISRVHSKYQLFMVLWTWGRAGNPTRPDLVDQADGDTAPWFISLLFHWTALGSSVQLTWRRYLWKKTYRTASESVENSEISVFKAGGSFWREFTAMCLLL